MWGCGPCDATAESRQTPLRRSAICRGKETAITFRIHALPAEPFRALIDLDDVALAAIGVRRMIAETPNSAPCRVSLADAEPGERLILLNHRHLDAPDSPYRSEGPIFVREAAAEAHPIPGEVLEMLARRLLSARASDAEAMMVQADIVEGCDLADLLSLWFEDSTVDRIQLHTARRGCFMAEARRA